MLTLDMFVLLALLATVSAIDHSKTFHFSRYPRVFRRNEVACQVCYGEFDCVSLDSGRCGYNVEAMAILKEEEEKPIVNEALKKRVDSMMNDLLLEESIIKEYKDCVPIISSFTQCNKDNICTGCKTCDCDQSGRWNCSVIQKCSRTPLHVDHRVLGLVMDGLKIEHNATRSKRSNEAVEESATHSIYEDLARWMYESTPIQVKITNDTRTEVPITPAIETINDQDNNLAFDEILSNNDLAHFIQSSEKDITNMKTDNNDSEHFLQFLKNIEEGEDVIDSIDNTYLKIDLLNDLRIYFKEGNFDGKESSNSSKVQPNSINSILDTDDLDLNRHPLDINSATRSLIRNARHVNATVNKNATSTLKNDTKNITQTQSKEELQHLAEVVSVLINNQRKEIVHLNYVKDNLLKFIKKCKFNSSSTSTDAVHKQDGRDSKKHGWKDDMLNFYLSNLNKDIKDILKDIYAIEKLRKLGVAPEAGRVSNIKPLLLVLSSYYLKNNPGNRQKEILMPNFFVNDTKPTLALNTSTTTTTNASVDTEPKPKRRVFNPKPDNVYNVKLLKRALTRMLLIIDNGRLSTTAINALSPSTKRIFNRIVSKQYAISFAGTAVRDSHSNLTQILTSLAQLWKKAEVDIFKFQPADRLYNMKLLYFTLTNGMDRIKEALIWIQFGLSRRMNFIEEHIGRNMIDDASEQLDHMGNGIKKWANKAAPKITKGIGSAWKDVKNAFKKTKDGITFYFKSKLRSRSYIVDENVRRRVEEVNRRKFLDVMRRWQEHFDDYQPRNKRSLIHYVKRMKNIIPKYLRGKVNSGLGAQWTHKAKLVNRGQSTTKRFLTTTKKHNLATVSIHKTTKK